MKTKIILIRSVEDVGDIDPQRTLTTIEGAIILHFLGRETAELMIRHNWVKWLECQPIGSFMDFLMTNCPDFQRVEITDTVDLKE